MVFEKVAKKLALLADAAKYDASCASSGAKRSRPVGGLGHSQGMGICHSYTPDGRCISLLKLLLTNFCIYDCSYCINRQSSNVARAKFTPQEVVDITIDFYKRNYIEGLFLSSGVIRSADDTMEQLIYVAKTLRESHRFGGYIHLKAVPGASPSILEEAGKYADRVSANIELPEQKDLDVLAPGKSHQDTAQTMFHLKGLSEEKKEEDTFALKKASRKRRFLPAGQSTQMIVGASESSDKKILNKSTELYQSYRLRRVYYSAFSPIPDSSSLLPSLSPPLMREHRLYQADWLLRFYKFTADEIPTANNGNLLLDRDPKLAWALSNPTFFPLNLNTADLEQLLRVPGLGVKTVRKIVQSRKLGSLSLEDLKALRVSIDKVKYFVTARGWMPPLKMMDPTVLQNVLVRPISVQSQLALWA